MENQSTIQGVAKALGLKEAAAHGYSRVWLSDQLIKGLPFSSYDQVAKKVFAGEARVPHLGMSPSTIKRRRQDKKRLSPEVSQRLERVARAWTMAVDVYRNEADARRFLTTPHMILHHKTPLSVAIANDVGADAVEDLLGRLKYGSAA